MDGDQYLFEGETLVIGEWYDLGQARGTDRRERLFILVLGNVKR
jgi:hypothetical protein